MANEPKNTKPRVNQKADDEKVEDQQTADDVRAEDEPRASSMVENARKTIEAEQRQQEALSRSRENRSREHDSRVDELSEDRATHLERPEEPWQRPSSLAAPEPRPGMVQRWIRHSVRGVDDPRNVTMKMREGWTPRPIDTIPEEFTFIASRADAQAGQFVVDDLMLCEMPLKKFKQRSEYYRRQTERQMEAVTHDLERTQVAGHPIQREHTSKVSHPPRVIGRRVEAADD